MQTSASKIGKRLLALALGAAVAVAVGYQTLKGFREKIQSFFETGSVEKLEEKKDSKVFKVQGQADSADTTEPQSQPEK